MSETTKDIGDEGRYDLEARCARAEQTLKRITEHGQCVCTWTHGPSLDADNLIPCGVHHVWLSYKTKDLEARCTRAEQRIKQLEEMLRLSEADRNAALGRYDILKMEFVALKKQVLPQTLSEQVAEFHAAMGLPGLGPSSSEGPKVPSDERVRLRASLIVEEVFETLEAMFECSFHVSLEVVKERIAHAVVKVDMVAFADGLADTNYVVAGTFLEFGIDDAAIAAEVHRANMTKVGGPIREDGKKLKPAGWTPPDIEGELRKQGWKL